MLFNSFSFLVFLPLVLIAFYATPKQWRYVILLAASYFFYGSWNPIYLLLIAFSTLVDYWAGLNIYNQNEAYQKKRWLWLSIITNLSLLFVFKYFNFFIDSAQDALQLIGIAVRPIYLELLLPVGISFYTFQTLSYTIDIYKGDQKPEKSLAHFALYVAFFPQLVAGPIEKAKNLLPQLKTLSNANANQVVEGLNRIAYGFFKKVVIADNLSIYVNHVFANSENAGFYQVLLGASFFLIQVYTDFSGYSDIAYGTAKLFGVDITLNFNKPFKAFSLRDFWRRWHITLTQWVTEYIYIPLGGNRKGTVKRNLNIVLAFTIMGLWHGANYTFVVWGFMHGMALMLSHYLPSFQKNLVSRFVGQLSIFAFFSFSMLFFRSESTGQAFELISNALHFKGIGNYRSALAGVSLNNLLFYLALVPMLFISYKLRSHFRFKYSTAFLLIATIAIIILGTYEKQEFVYFQF